MPLRDPVATGTTWELATKWAKNEVTISLTVESITDQRHGSGRHL